MQLRLVPRMSDVHASDVPVMAEPVVNWEEAKAVTEQPAEERFPSEEQAAMVDEVGDLAARLTAFYFDHNRAMLETVGEVSRKFVGREDELNDALRRKYKSDLKAMVAEQEAAKAEQAEQDAAAARKLLEEEEAMLAAQNAVAAAAEEEKKPALSEEVRDAIANFEAMGFTDRAVNLELLRKHDNNVEAALNELLG